MKKYILIAISVCIVLLGTQLTVNVLVVENHHDNRVLLQERVEPGFTFATLIKHSVHLTPVYEYYEINTDGDIILTGTKFVDLGWGVPSTYEYETIFADGMIELKDMDIPIDWLPFRVSSINNSKLFLKGKRIVELNNYFDNNERMDIRVEKVSFIKYWIRGETDDFQ
ncbi:MAG TPA: DUF1850 domain-containing protein [Clostridia bacterium]|nr:DUF1850 domain-containing protein [Clostridia bacterium]